MSKVYYKIIFNYILLMCFVFTISACSSSSNQTPNWISKLPKTDNKTFVYRCESGRGFDREEAYNKAMVRIFESAANSLGVRFDSKSIKEAIENGESLDLISESFSIPVNKVCEYEQLEANGDSRVYVLCQVANAGNIDVEFDSYNDCGNFTGGLDNRKVVNEFRPINFRDPNYKELRFSFSSCYSKNNEVVINGFVENTGKDALKVMLNNFNIKAYTDGGLELQNPHLIFGDNLKQKYPVERNVFSGERLPFSLIFKSYERHIKNIRDLTFNKTINPGNYSKIGRAHV